MCVCVCVCVCARARMCGVYVYVARVCVFADLERGASGAHAEKQEPLRFWEVCFYVCSAGSGQQPQGGQGQVESGVPEGGPQ